MEEAGGWHHWVTACGRAVSYQRPQHSPVPTGITPPVSALHDKEAGAAAGCYRLFTCLCWAEGQSHNVFPKPPLAAEPGLCPCFSSSVPIPALQTLWFPALGTTCLGQREV